MEAEELSQLPVLTEKMDGMEMRAERALEFLVVVERLCQMEAQRLPELLLAAEFLVVVGETWGMVVGAERLLE